jgi:hypothetical protein
VKEQALPGGLKKHMLDHIRNDVKRKGERGSPCHSPLRYWIQRTGIQLGRTSVLLVSFSILIQDRRTSGKPLANRILSKGVPVDRVKCFAEIELENCCRGSTLVASLNNVSLRSFQQ